MSVHSAGILMYRYAGERLEVLLVHPGGPFWAGKGLGAWSIPKGLVDADEALLDAAKREFQEETGFEVGGAFMPLGELRMHSGKIVHAWAVEGDLDTSRAHSNTFTLEWPKHSGVVREYPEVDEAQWFGLDEAGTRIANAQTGFLERLVAQLKGEH